MLVTNKLFLAKNGRIQFSSLSPMEEHLFVSENSLSSGGHCADFVRQGAKGKELLHLTLWREQLAHRPALQTMFSLVSREYEKYLLTLKTKGYEEF